jgi:hypothetical protein
VLPYDPPSHWAACYVSKTIFRALWRNINFIRIFVCMLLSATLWCYISKTLLTALWRNINIIQIFVWMVLSAILWCYISNPLFMALWRNKKFIQILVCMLMSATQRPHFLSSGMLYEQTLWRNINFIRILVCMLFSATVWPPLPIQLHVIWADPFYGTVMQYKLHPNLDVHAIFCYPWSRTFLMNYKTCTSGNRSTLQYA